MRVTLQRVTEASVSVEEKTVGKIGRGFVLFLGIGKDDSENDIDWLVSKITKMRLFDSHPHSDSPSSLSLEEIKGEVLIISQFTLFASTKKGTRPSFHRSAPPEKAKTLYHQFIQKMTDTLSLPPQTGIFGAMMQVSLINDGPVTILLDTQNKE